MAETYRPYAPEQDLLLPPRLAPSLRRRSRFFLTFFSAQASIVFVGFVAPRKDARATGNGTMAAVPRRIALRLLSGFSLPLNAHGAVSRDVFLDDPHVAVEIAPAAQVKLFRSGDEFQKVWIG
jgi:hypothetical protein